MSVAKYFFAGTLVVFCGIGFIGYKNHSAKETTKENTSLVEEVALPEKKIEAPPPPAPSVVLKEVKKDPPSALRFTSPHQEVDRVAQLFALDGTKLPIVETVSYTSRVPWLKGRPAWISDYASHYETSRHFIARSLNKKADYFRQKVGPGDRFNVFKKDKNIRFHLAIDLSKSLMRFSYIDLDANERVLLKTYRVGLGRVDPEKKSGFLTPVGKYELGERVAIYKPGTMGVFQDKKTEMIQVFGSRWIPFGKEIEGCSEPAKGLGIHGAPWVLDPASGQLVEDANKIGKYDSDGCIRLSQADMEELFAIVITKPTTVEIVPHFEEVTSPGVEK